MTESVDVAVIGAGPAGAAAAIALRLLGRTAMLVDAGRPTAVAFGEALPPEATPLLQQLGVWHAFTAAGHLPAVGSESAWGSARVAARSFITTPYARGWHLRRDAFDAMLRQRACDAGARFIQGRVRDLVRDGDWQLTVETSGRRVPCSARWIVDATGRAGWVAARLGVRRLHGPPLTAAAVMFERQDRQPADADRTTLVETAQFGWCYTACLPGRHRIALCFTQPEDAPRTLDRFMQLCAGTIHTSRRLNGYRPLAGPSLVAAHSSTLERSAGQGWIAVGDAACAFDPVSSYGLASALGTGIGGAGAVDAALAGRMAAMTAFELRLRSAFERYMNTHDEVYAMEQRWPDCAFWRSRSSSRTGAPVEIAPLTGAS